MRTDAFLRGSPHTSSQPDRSLIFLIPKFFPAFALDEMLLNGTYHNATYRSVTFLFGSVLTGFKEKINGIPLLRNSPACGFRGFRVAADRRAEPGRGPIRAARTEGHRACRG